MAKAVSNTVRVGIYFSLHSILQETDEEGSSKGLGSQVLSQRESASELVDVDN